jgi:hypothetical protein
MSKRSREQMNDDIQLSLRTRDTAHDDARGNDPMLFTKRLGQSQLALAAGVVEQKFAHRKFKWRTYRFYNRLFGAETGA